MKWMVFSIESDGTNNITHVYLTPSPMPYQAHSDAWLLPFRYLTTCSQMSDHELSNGWSLSSQYLITWNDWHTSWKKRKFFGNYILFDPTPTPPLKKGRGAAAPTCTLGDWLRTHVHSGIGCAHVRSGIGCAHVRSGIGYTHVRSLYVRVGINTW